MKQWYRQPTFNHPLLSELSWEERGLFATMTEVALKANDPNLTPEWMASSLGIHRQKAVKICPKFLKILAIFWEFLTKKYPSNQRGSREPLSINNSITNSSDTSYQEQAPILDDGVNNRIDGKPSQKEPAAVPHPVWDDAVQKLMETGEKESSVRSYLGRAMKEYGEDVVSEAVSTMILKAPVNPKAYLIGVLNNKPKLGQKLSSVRIVPSEQRKGGEL